MQEGRGEGADSLRPKAVGHLSHVSWGLNLLHCYEASPATPVDL